MHVTRLLFVSAALLFCAISSAEDSGGGGSGGNGSGGGGSGGAGGGQESRNIEFEMTGGTRTNQGSGSDSMLAQLASLLGACGPAQDVGSDHPAAGCSPDESH